ncbi:hypothetical protein BDV23DRAFT_164538 [Aspergillus alliaceus]|uniref:Uncharacterized protein n=1 Tax=Petromyces alliaceus TaxID=209559 RepID=A0A5N7BUZ3_PETAA|nr:hypothetical protein BDV23DRAFT_164538 [Aspergillus alliaceus]
MGIWKSGLSSKHEGNLEEGLRRMRKGEGYDLHFQENLAHIIRSSYQPQGDEKAPSHDDFFEASKILAVYLSACLAGQVPRGYEDSPLFSQGQSGLVYRALDDKWPADQAVAELLKLYLESEQGEGGVEGWREDQARSVFAALLKVTTVDKINTFGNALATSAPHFARNNAIHHLDNLVEKGTFDNETRMAFRKVLKSDMESMFFGDFFGKVDIVSFASQARGEKDAILKAMAEKSVMQDALSRAILL